MVKVLNVLVLGLLILGGLNLGLIGLFQVDLLGLIFGGTAAVPLRLLYVLVGIAAVYSFRLFGYVGRSLGARVMAPPAGPSARLP